MLLKWLYIGLIFIVITPFISSYRVHRALCVLPKHSGKGTFWKIRWYYDRNWRACRIFRFYGRRVSGNGNSNNFASWWQCNKNCPYIISENI